MELKDLKPAEGSRKNRKRVGRLEIFEFHMILLVA